MGTENSSLETRERAKKLGEALGSYHLDLNMDTLVTAVRAKVLMSSRSSQQAMNFWPRPMVYLPLGTLSKTSSSSSEMH